MAVLLNNYVIKTTIILPWQNMKTALSKVS